jgi:calcium-dependent protein kinase
MNKSCDPKDIDIRLIDFGLAKELKVKRLKDREMVGTHTYMAPEVIEGIYSTKCDMWSAGVVLLNMIGRKNPFKGRSKEETLEKIKKDKLNFSGSILIT